MKARITNGYSKQLAGEYVDPDSPFYFLSSEPLEQSEYKNGKPSGKIGAYQYWFVQEGVNPFKIKFFEKLDENLNQMEQVKIDSLEATEYKRNIYFKAIGLEVVE